MASREYEIRKCTEADVDLLDAAWPSGGKVGLGHFNHQSTEGSTFLVAWSSADPVGYAVVQWGGYSGALGRAASVDAIEINHLQVRSDQRGRGVGTALMAAAEQTIRERGGTVAAVGVDESNTDARRLYERLGYRRTGVWDTCAYDWVDDQGQTDRAVETSEMLIKVLT